MTGSEMVKAMEGYVDAPIVIKDGDQYYHVQSITPMSDCFMLVAGGQFMPKSGGGTMARGEQVETPVSQPETTPDEPSTEVASDI